MDNRRRGQRRIRRRLHLGWRQQARGVVYEARRAAHRWLCRHVALVRWGALIDAQWDSWQQFVKRQEKHRSYNDYLVWKAERDEVGRTATKRQSKY